MKPYADPPARAHLSPRYVALLAGIALVVLFVGALLRPAKASRAPAVSTSELVSLPALSQRRSLRDLAAYVRERAEAVAPSVLYLPSVGASARWALRSSSE